VGLFSNIWSKPKQKATALYGSNPARVLPRGRDALAGGFPEWLDPVTMELDRKAYTVLRRADAVAFPMEKLATLLATRKLTVVCQENPNFAKDVQRYCVDHILGATDAIKWLSWGIIEGVRFMFIDAYAVRDWYVPTLRGGGEKKVKADGLITWDGGQNIVSRRQLVGGAMTPPEDAEAKQYERHRWMVYRPGAGSNPEGDTDLAYRLYRIAYQSLELDKSWAAYAERYGLPVPVFKEMVRLGASDEASQAMSDGARKAALLKRGAAVGLTADQALDFINPDGTAWGFLIEASREYEARAHKAILLNTTSSAPQSVGPDQRGSSDIHKSEEELAVEALALSMKDTCLRDLQAFIEVANSERLREIARANSETPNIVRIPNWHIELQPSVIERENNATDVLAYYNAGVPINANELYGPAGLTVPEGSEDIITKKEPDPFGGFGGGFGGGALPQRTQLAFNSPVEELALSPAPFAQEALPPSSLQVTPEPQPEPVKSPPAHMDRLEERADIDELYDAEGLRTEFQDEMNKALFAVAEQLEQGKASPKLPESVLMMIAKTSALAELAGRAEAQTNLNERYLANQSDAVVSLAAERAKLSRIHLATDSDDSGWRTLDNGTKVKIGDDGKIEAGPPNTQGKTLSEAFGGSKEKPSDNGSVGTLAAMIVQDLRDRNEYQDAAINDLPARDFLKDQINERREKLYSLAKEIMGSDDDDAADTLMTAVTINDRAGYNIPAPKLVEFAKEAAAEQFSPFADGFEDRMIERFNLSALSERVKLAEVWRTIGAQDGKGGTPVQIDTDTGKIKSGPKNLEGRSVQSISESQRDRRGPEGDSPLEVIGGAVASTYEAVQDALASDTVQNFLSTVFVPNRFVWQGKQLWDRFWRETGDTGHVGDDGDSQSAWRFLWQGGG